MLRAAPYLVAIFSAASSAHASSWEHVTDNVYVDKDSISLNGYVATATIKTGSTIKKSQFHCNNWEFVDLATGEGGPITMGTVGGAVMSFVCSYRSDGCWRMPGQMESYGWVDGELVCPSR